jgi:hypothetical protein
LSWFAVLWTSVWGGLTLALLFLAAAQWTGLDPAPDVEAALGAVMTACFTGAIAAAGVYKARDRQERLPAPGLSSVPPPEVRPEKRFRLPRPKSSARQPMLDLAEAEAGLAELLRQLTDLPDEPVPPPVISDAWRTATDTAARLRAVAARLEAVELAAEHAPPRDWAGLEDGAGGLRLHLDQGLDAYRALIGAAGRVVLAGPPVVASTELVEATDTLAGLAEALRELATPIG